MSRDKLQRYKVTGHVQWDIYNIVRDAFCLYQNIEVKTPKITQVELIKNMQFDQYVRVDGVKSGKSVRIIILARDEKDSNEITSTTEKFRLFYNNNKQEGTQLMIISPCNFQTHVANFIISEGLNKQMDIYDYDNFKTVIPLCPGACDMRIMTPDEITKFMEFHKIEIKDMKKTYTYNPQIIWLGAKHNDIVWIDRYNPISGISSDIRRVVRL